MPRLIIPGCPHHVTQRGNRKLQAFFSDEDYFAYIKLTAALKEQTNVGIWAYCLMPNHVHLVLVPSDKKGLSKFMQQVHRRYARRINKRQGWQGHLWQERFYSVPMDERHLYAAVRYIELNPVAAELCRTPTEWKWSSIHAHLRKADDQIVSVDPMLKRVSDWGQYLVEGEDSKAIDNLRRNAKSGRPVGNSQFIDHLERTSGRRIRKKKPGPVPINEISKLTPN